jgi:DNA-binding HxlR family transcriptional regulator
MGSQRTYADRCGVSRALDVIGERWALLVVRELMFGPKRFSDLRSGLPSVSPNVLSERLRDLKESGILVSRRLGPPASAQVYELTSRGRELAPVLIELGRWGSAAPAPPGSDMSVDSHMLALQTLFDARAARDLDARIVLDIEGDRFAARVAGSRLALARDADAGGQAVIRTDRPTLRALLWESLGIADARRSGRATIDGDRRLARRFLRLFPRPAV